LVILYQYSKMVIGREYNIALARLHVEKVKYIKYCQSHPRHQAKHVSEFEIPYSRVIKRVQTKPKIRKGEWE
jgi:hypothetical protein